jgi:hypothetical protein
MEMITEKKCTKCGEIKPIGKFTRKRQMKSGYHNWCKDCTRNMVRQSAKKKTNENNYDRLVEIEKLNPFKICNKCGLKKPLSDFHILRQRADGHDEVCSECRKLQYENLVNNMTDDEIRKIAIANPLKICSDCKQIKSISEFTICRETFDGRYAYCNVCKIERMKKYYQNNLEYRIDYRNGNRDETNRKYCKYNGKIKIEILTHYGNGKCACVICGESRLPCLSIDHINNDGGQQRKIQRLTGVRFYKWLKDNNFPGGYQTLCMNDQFLKAFGEIPK